MICHRINGKILIIFVLLVIKTSFCLIDPFTIGAIAGLGALGYNFETIKRLTYCKYNECCIDEYISADTEALKSYLKKNLFGQHIVIDELIPALQGHWSQSRNSQKPLVISLHGTPGTGKNYVADFIAKSLFKKGLESQYVHKFSGQSDFIENSYSITMKVRNAVSRCPRSLFIFDEVDKMPAGVFERLTSLLDYHAYLDGVDYRKATFIFLSNSAGVMIGKQLINLMEQGKLRGETKLADYEKVLEIGAYNLQGGFHKSSVIKSHLIDHYIPFLPLEKDHIRRCLIAEFQRFGVWSPPSEKIESFIDNYVTFDDQSGLFATAGCKRLHKKVQTMVYGGY